MTIERKKAEANHIFIKSVLSELNIRESDVDYVHQYILNELNLLTATDSRGIMHTKHTNFFFNRVYAAVDGPFYVSNDKCVYNGESIFSEELKEKYGCATVTDHRFTRGYYLYIKKPFKKQYQTMFNSLVNEYKSIDEQAIIDYCKSALQRKLDQATGFDLEHNKNWPGIGEKIVTREKEYSKIINSL